MDYEVLHLGFRTRYHGGMESCWRRLALDDLLVFLIRAITRILVTDLAFQSSGVALRGPLLAQNRLCAISPLYFRSGSGPRLGALGTNGEWGDPFAVLP
jgi:hypothetical protein